MPPPPGLNRHYALNGVSCRYMQRAKLADLFIDTPLVNAHTSATDVLWAGVPMVTLPRKAMISRVAASILIADGMQHLIARNLDVAPPLTSSYHTQAAFSQPLLQDYINMAAAFKRVEGGGGVAGRARAAAEAARKKSDLFDTQVRCMC